MPILTPIWLMLTLCFPLEVHVGIDDIERVQKEVLGDWHSASVERIDALLDSVVAIDVQSGPLGAECFVVVWY